MITSRSTVESSEDATVSWVKKLPEDDLKQLLHNFVKAVEEYGRYCPVKNEVKIRKRGKVYRFRCGHSLLYFTDSEGREIEIPIASDATIHELKRSIGILIESAE